MEWERLEVEHYGGDLECADMQARSYFFCVNYERLWSNDCTICVCEYLGWLAMATRTLPERGLWCWHARRFAQR